MKRTMTKRFYVGTASIGSNGFLKTLPEAIADAKAKLEAGDDERFIVEVVKVVRRQSSPIVVEDVR